MRKLKIFFTVLLCVIAIELVFVGMFVSGTIKPKCDSSQGVNTSPKTEAQIQMGINQQLGSDESDSDQTILEDEKLSHENVSTALNVTLTGEYLKAYNKAVQGLGNSESDKNKKLVTKIGLQILQSKTIKYENKLHFYSLNYTSSGGSKAAIYYDLKDCINRINSGEKIYTDCFGFVRLTYSIACYTLNSNNPSSVAKLSELYGYKGAYTGNVISSLSKLSSGTVIYDRLTGTGSSKNRHVAMYLYSDGDKVVYMDQSGVFEAVYKDYSYIYYSGKSNPYKFNTYKNYC